MGFSSTPTLRSSTSRQPPFSTVHIYWMGIGAHPSTTSGAMEGEAGLCLAVDLELSALSSLDVSSTQDPPHSELDGGSSVALPTQGVSTQSSSSSSLPSRQAATPNLAELRFEVQPTHAWAHTHSHQTSTLHSHVPSMPISQKCDVPSLLLLQRSVVEEAGVDTQRGYEAGVDTQESAPLPPPSELPSEPEPEPEPEPGPGPGPEPEPEPEPGPGPGPEPEPEPEPETPSSDPATIKNNGVEVAASLLEGAGRGLFARRRFAPRALITEYTGQKLVDKFAAAERFPQTHIFHMSPTSNGQMGNGIYIDGDREPIEGSGGGSFANHLQHKHHCNAEFALVDDEVFLRAKRGIEEGEEIYVHCGTDLDVMMGWRRRIVTTDVDGRRCVVTVAIPSEGPGPGQQRSTRRKIAALSAAQDRSTAQDLQREATLSTASRSASGASADVDQATSVPYYEYVDSGPGHELDGFMALCGTLIHPTGKKAKKTDSYLLYGQHDWEYRLPALKGSAACEQGYRTLLAFVGEGGLLGGATFRPLGNQTFEIVMLRVTATGKGVGGALVDRLKADLVAHHGEGVVVLAEAVEGPARDKKKVARFFSKRCGFQQTEEAERILDRYYLEKELSFYVDQQVDVNDTRAVDDARREWTQPWTGQEVADRCRSQLTFTWNTCRAPHKMIWRAAASPTPSAPLLVQPLPLAPVNVPQRVIHSPRLLACATPSGGEAAVETANAEKTVAVTAAVPKVPKVASVRAAGLETRSAEVVGVCSAVEEAVATAKAEERDGQSVVDEHRARPSRTHQRCHPKSVGGRGGAQRDEPAAAPSRGRHPSSEPSMRRLYTVAFTWPEGVSWWGATGSGRQAPGWYADRLTEQIELRASDGVSSFQVHIHGGIGPAALDELKQRWEAAFDAARRGRGCPPGGGGDDGGDGGGGGESLELVVCDASAPALWPHASRVLPLLEDRSDRVVVCIDVHDAVDKQTKEIESLLERMCVGGVGLGLTSWPGYGLRSSFAHDDPSIGPRPTLKIDRATVSDADNGIVWHLDCGLLISNAEFRRELRGIQGQGFEAHLEYCEAHFGYDPVCGTDEMILEMYLLAGRSGDQHLSQSVDRLLRKSASIRAHVLRPDPAKLNCGEVSEWSKALSQHRPAYVAQKRRPRRFVYDEEAEMSYPRAGRPLELRWGEPPKVRASARGVGGPTRQVPLIPAMPAPLQPKPCARPPPPGVNRGGNADGDGRLRPRAPPSARLASPAERPPAAVQLGVRGGWRVRSCTFACGSDAYLVERRGRGTTWEAHAIVAASVHLASLGIVGWGLYLALPGKVLPTTLGVYSEKVVSRHDDERSADEKAVEVTKHSDYVMVIKTTTKWEVVDGADAGPPFLQYANSPHPHGVSNCDVREDGAFVVSDVAERACLSTPLADQANAELLYEYGELYELPRGRL